MEDRSTDFKKGIDKEESRKKRQMISLNHRKQRRVENLRKKRNVKQTEGEDADFSNLYLYIDMMKFGSNDEKIVGTERMRKLLSSDDFSITEDLMQNDIISCLVSFLQWEDDKMKIEAAWCLTNITSCGPEEVNVVVESNAIPYLVDLLGCDNPEVLEHGIWALANIAGETESYRDFILFHDTMSYLLEATKTNQLTLLQITVWCISNLLRGKPSPAWDDVANSVPYLTRLLFASDIEVLEHTCWSLSFLSDISPKFIQAFLGQNVSKKMVELMYHPEKNIKLPALRTIGNILFGNDTQVQVLLNCSVLQTLKTLMQSPNENICKEACWAVSNVTAGNTLQVQEVFDQGMIEIAMNNIKHLNFDIKKECLWLIYNSTVGSSNQQIDFLVNLDAIGLFCNELNAEDPRIILLGLKGIDNIIRKSTYNRIDLVTAVEACEGLDSLERLQDHPSEEVYDLASKILTTYFVTSPVDNDIINPALSNQSSTKAFHF